MKYFLFSLFMTTSIISTAVADDTFVLDTERLKEEALAQAHNQFDYFSMFDLDGNQKLSPTECSGSFEGLENIPYFTKEELIEMKKNIDNSFSDFDKNKDGYLDKTEASEYFSFIEKVGLSAQMKKIDPDGDGKITDNEINMFMKKIPSIDESIAKLKEMTKKLNKINQNPQQHVDQMLSNLRTATNNEEFIQMDTNKNEQVTIEEYTNYMYNHPNNKELGFSKEDYKNMYYLMDSAKKGYVTHQEYMDYQQKQFNEIMSDTRTDKKID